MKQQAWVVVVPQKNLAMAKSRLRLPQEARRRVASAMFNDCVQTVRDTDNVQGAVVVVDTASDAAGLDDWSTEVLEQPSLGLNAAIQAGADHAQQRWPGSHVAALPADLASLSSAELSVALETASARPRTFVADRFAAGTTLLTALAGEPLNPGFGPQSRSAHQQSGAWENPDPRLISLRHDADTPSDLADLINLVSTRRLGPHVKSVLESLVWNTPQGDRMKLLDGRAAIVTGGSQGLGRAIADRARVS